MLDPVWFAAGCLAAPAIVAVLFFAVIGWQKLRDRA
jgi:hypothetical protein